MGFKPNTASSGGGGGSSPWSSIATASPTNAASSTITSTLTAGNLYKLIVNIKPGTGTFQQIFLTFNADGGAHYSYYYQGYHPSSGAIAALKNDGDVQVISANSASGTYNSNTDVSGSTDALQIEYTFMLNPITLRLVEGYFEGRYKYAGDTAAALNPAHSFWEKGYFSYNGTAGITSITVAPDNHNITGTIELFALAL